MNRLTFKISILHYLGLFAVELLIVAVFSRVFYDMFFGYHSMLFEFAWFYYSAYLVVMSTYVGLFAALFAIGRGPSPWLWGIAGFSLTGLAIWSYPDLVPRQIPLGVQLVLYILLPLLSTALLSILIALSGLRLSKVENDRVG